MKKILVLLFSISFITNCFYSHKLHASDDFLAPLAAVDTSGNMIVFWTTHDQVFASIKPSLGSFGTPFLISGTETNIYNLQVATDSLGNIIVGWIGYDNALLRNNVYVTSFISGAWTSTHVNVSGTASSDLVSFDSIAINPSGRLLVTWSAYNTTSGNFDIYAATALLAGFIWTTPSLIYAP